MEAFCFDPKSQTIEVGIGYLRRIKANTVQLGFLEVAGFQKRESKWSKTTHDKGNISADHPLIDSAMAAWKFGEHLSTVN